MSPDHSIETLLERPYWLIDVLPRRVPAEAAGRYFRVERYLLSRLESICGKFAEVLIGLSCYKELLVRGNGDRWVRDPAPEELQDLFGQSLAAHSPLYVLIPAAEPGALLTFSGEDHYMTLYNPDEHLLELVRPLAAAAGLFVWNPR